VGQSRNTFNVAFGASLLMFVMYQCIMATLKSGYTSRHDNSKRSMCRCDETLRRCVFTWGQHCFV